MSVKKLTLASLILLSLTACSSGSGSSPANSSSDQLKTQLTQSQTALAKANNDLNAAKSELAKALSDKNTTAQALETAKTNLAAAERAKATAEQAASTANNQKQAVQNELNATKSALTQAQTALTNATNELNTAKIKLAKVQADKTSTPQDLETAKANLAAAEKALEGKTAVIKEIMSKAAAITEENKGVGSYNWIAFDENRLPNGLSKHPFISISAENQDGIFVGNHYVYLTPSVRLVARDTTAYWNDSEQKQSAFRVQGIFGERSVALPQSGVVTYNGKGFNADNIGTLHYQVDFANKTGSGSISQFNNANIPTIVLEQGNIEAGIIKSNASTNTGRGKYELGFYGQDAQTVAGEAYLSQNFEGGVTTNNATAKKYGDTERGTVFGIVGERQ